MQVMQRCGDESETLACPRGMPLDPALRTGVTLSLCKILDAGVESVPTPQSGRHK